MEPPGKRAAETHTHAQNDQQIESKSNKTEIVAIGLFYSIKMSFFDPSVQKTHYIWGLSSYTLTMLLSCALLSSIG